MNNFYVTEGKHVVCDLWDVDPLLSDNSPYLKQICKFAIAKAGAKFLSMQEKKFKPTGVSLLLMLEESHLSLHSYPSDNGYIALCCHTCGKTTDPDKAIDYIIEQLKPKEVYRQTIIRGVR